MGLTISFKNDEIFKSMKTSRFFVHLGKAQTSNGKEVKETSFKIP